VYALSTFFLEALRAMSFPLRTSFIVFHKFRCVVASFLLNSKKSLISFFISSLTKESLRRVLSVSTRMLAFYYLCCYWRSVLVCGDQIGCMG
jgi:hypothetical protein